MRGFIFAEYLKLSSLRPAVWVCLGAASATWWNPWATFTTALFVTAAHVWMQRAVDRAPPSPVTSSPEQSNAWLAPQVVPVWRRNLMAANEHAERSMQGLLESFTNISGYLEKSLGAVNANLELGALDRLLTVHQPQLDALLSTTLEAVAMKNAALECLNELSDELDAMAAVSKQVQQIARATHLLALNASIEAAKASQGDSFGVVATEVRALASQSREAGLRMARQIQSMRERAERARSVLSETDGSEFEIRLRAEQNARALIASLLESVGELTRMSWVMRNASRLVQADLDRLFVDLQSQDRLSQMLSSVANDMQRYAEWTHGQSDPAAESARSWLDRLEATYPMEELRSSHHNTVAVDQKAAVEFF